MALERGSKLGPYEVLGELGAGGMGVVYKARDPRLERDVAVKVLPEKLAQDEDALMRFRRETKAVAALSHPNIRAIYDIGVDEGRPFAVMELLQGETLGDLLERSAPDWRRAVQLGLAVADGLAAAHERGIVHRDIKPHNIFITESGAIKILDFGLAQLAPGLAIDENTLTTPLTQPGAVMGTVLYMSPEQVRGKNADARSDIFAIGCVLYEILTRQRPFRRESPAETMAAILNDEPPALADSKVSVPGELQRVVTHCLEKNPSQRFQSARDLGFALRGLGGDLHAVDSGKQGTISAPREDPGQPPAQEQAEASVAVLPFVNMSSDKENEYFSDGLAEELINAMSKIDGLRVASRTSAFSFKGKSQDIRNIGEQLNVRTVLEGSVRKAGNRLRISAQLVNVADGYHLWSETFNREMEDVFEVQDEIAQSIARALRIVLSDKEKRAIAKAPTDNVQAYEYYLRGRQSFHQFRRKGLERARKLFARAYQLDPAYASAHAGVADCCSLLYTYFDANESYLKEADEASRRALELDSDLAEAHVARGLAISLSKRYEEARREFETAIEQNPELFEAYYFYGRACFAEGKLEQAAELFERACALRPEDFSAAAVLSSAYAGLGRDVESEDACRRCLEAAEKHLELFPEDGRAMYYGAGTLVRLGQHDRGREWAERALAAEPEEPVVLYNVACVYSLLGQIEKGIECLDEAITFGWGLKEWIQNDSDLTALRSHPRFEMLIDRM